MAKISIRNLNKKKRVSSAKILSLARFVFRRFRGWERSDVTVIFVSDPMIQKLNKKFKHRDRATDVLCFCYFEGVPACGMEHILKADIYISTDTARVNAARFGTSYADEVYLYVIHGLLHMMGHRDNTQTTRAKIDTVQQSLLKEFILRHPMQNEKYHFCRKP